MDPFSSPSSGSSSQPSTEVFMDQLKTQIAQAYMEEFVENKALKIQDYREGAHLDMGCGKGAYFSDLSLKNSDLLFHLADVMDSRLPKTFSI